jgi:hypothetical protein
MFREENFALQATEKSSISQSKQGFIKNTGRIVNQNNKTNPAVLFLLNTPGLKEQLR